MSLLADCFTKLMTEDILPNATCVKGTNRIQPYYVISQQNLVTVQQTKTAVKVEMHYTHTHRVVQTIYTNTLISKPSDDKNGLFASGFLFRQPDCTAAAVTHLQKCWKMYKNYCKSSPSTKGDQTMTCRDLLWMFKVHYVNTFFFFFTKEMYSYCISGDKYIILKT